MLGHDFGTCAAPDGALPVPARRAFIGQGAGGKASGVGMSQKEQKEVLQGFRRGGRVLYL